MLAADNTPLLKSVAICSVGELFGGVERHILGLLGGLQGHGIEVLLILFHDGELATQARSQGFEPVILPSQNWSLGATSRALARILRQQRVQIVHVHGYKATVFCALARLWYNFAMVKTEHGLPEPMVGRPLLVFRERLYHFLENVATRMTVATICYVTEDLRAHSAPHPAGLRVTIIPNGVADMDRAQFEHPPELHEDWFNLAIVGRLDTVKGHHVAIEALTTLAAPSNVHLHIIGVGPREAALRQLCERCSIMDRVHFLGFRRDVYNYIAHSDALLMPSLHEGLPYTLLEAMALGTPIIASRVGGLAEVLSDSDAGILVAPGDSAALAKAIVTLSSSLELQQRLRQNSQRLQRAKYSVGVMTDLYCGVYRDSLISMDRCQSN